MIYSKRNGLNVEYLIELTEEDFKNIPRRNSDIKKGEEQKGLRFELSDWDESRGEYVPTGKTAILNRGDIKDTRFGFIQKRRRPDCAVPFKKVKEFEFTIRKSHLKQVKKHGGLTAKYANGNVHARVIGY